MEIQSLTEFNYGEFLTIKIIKGRGGTDFRPVFEMISEISADLLIYFTDGDGIFPQIRNHNIPVIWALTKPNIVPFGQVIYL